MLIAPFHYFYIKFVVLFIKTNVMEIYDWSNVKITLPEGREVVGITPVVCKQIILHINKVNYKAFLKIIKAVKRQARGYGCGYRFTRIV